MKAQVGGKKSKALDAIRLSKCFSVDAGDEKMENMRPEGTLSWDNMARDTRSYKKLVAGSSIAGVLLPSMDQRQLTTYIRKLFRNSAAHRSNLMVMFKRGFVRTTSINSTDPALFLAQVLLLCAENQDIVLVYATVDDDGVRNLRTCEICGSTARNVAGVNEAELLEQWNEANDAVAVGPVPSAETRRFWRGSRFLNFLLACMVFAFVISWLFHFNVPS
ncbi:hypothetical protein RHGRI_027595 [Rhododendron griersonianum]|uniref:Uncharacterized protein n=1 Tax=Rhododendron griersonianum TaxID=479676 RepID=A0AAV6J1N4_9ERIC|nr:hypothetical protein RHGRI_027595 [Rhododendron griersonianum]